MPNRRSFVSRNGSEKSTSIARSSRKSQPFDGAFVPERELILEMPKGVAIERAVALDRATDPRVRPAMYASAGAVSDEDALRDIVLDAYARCGFDDRYAGIPPELLKLYRDGHAAANLASR